MGRNDAFFKKENMKKINFLAILATAVLLTLTSCKTEETKEKVTVIEKVPLTNVFGNVLDYGYNVVRQSGDTLKKVYCHDSIMGTHKVPFDATMESYIDQVAGGRTYHIAKTN